MSATPAKPWDIRRVKNERPTVQIRHAGKVHTGRIEGLRLQFWHVRIGNGEAALTFEFSWLTIIDALDSGAILQA